MLVRMVLAVFAAAVIAAAALAHPDNAWLRTWIPPHCCVTNDCCFDVRADAIEALGADQYRILASGQVIARTGFSPDGAIWRCACDFIDGAWRVHAKALTRCLFIPRPST